MPELLVPVSAKDQKTTADANGRGQRDKATQQARIRARVESGMPKMTMHLRSIKRHARQRHSAAYRPFLPHGEERAVAAIVATS